MAARIHPAAANWNLVPFFPDWKKRFCTKQDVKRGVDAPHQHNFVQMWYVMDGTYRQFWEGEEVTLGKGSLFVVPPYSAHYIDTRTGPNILECSFSDWWIGLEEVLREIYFCGQEPKRENTGLPCYFFSKEAALEVESILHELERIYHLHDPFYLPYARTQLLRFSSAVAGASVAETGENGRFFSHMADLFSALDSIHENYMEKIYVKDAARLAMMSERAFSWVFKQITAMTFTEYVTYLRVLHAREMLAETGRIQFDIGRSCGFYDAACFQRAFKRLTGVLPGEFRRHGGQTKFPECGEI